jgi:hypothetical protein
MTDLDNKVKEYAQLWHDKYEELAPSFGYQTRPDTKQLDFDSPNGKLMYEVAKHFYLDRERKVLRAKIWAMEECYHEAQIDNFRAQLEELEEYEQN